MTTPYPGNSNWPPTWQPCTLTGHFLGLDGLPASGARVTLRVPFDRLYSQSDDTVVLARDLIITLDVNGEFTTQIPASDDPDIFPNGWMYEFTDPDGNLYTFAASVGATVDISDLQQVNDPATQAPVSKGDKGNTGDTGPVGPPSLNGNQVVDPSFATGVTNWNQTPGSGFSFVGGQTPPTDSTSTTAVNLAPVAGVQGQTIPKNAQYSAEPGSSWLVTIKSKRSESTAVVGSVNLIIACKKGDGTTVYKVVTTFPIATMGQAWVTYGGVMVMPADTVSFFAYLQCNTGTTTTLRQQFTDMNVRRASITDAQPGEWTKLTTPGSAGTYLIPDWAKMIRVIWINSGPGGGSGCRRASGVALSGGGGGATGHGGDVTLNADDLRAAYPTGVTWQVPAGGAGGAAPTTDNTDGNPGGNGGSTIFGSASNTGVSNGNGTLAGGRGGTTANANGGVNNASAPNGGQGVLGAAGGAGVNLNFLNGLFRQANAGAGAGGGISAAGTAFAGGAGGVVAGLANGAVGGAVPGGAGSNVLTAKATLIPGNVAGVSGGAGSVTGNGGNGADATEYGQSGGGGGSCLNGFTPGRGGNGAGGALFILATP